MLTEQNEETMIFSKCVLKSQQTNRYPCLYFLHSLLRLRQELTKLIETHTGKLSVASARAKARSAIYEELLQGLTVCRTQVPLNYFLNRFPAIAGLSRRTESLKSPK
jgi:hypothetical protein